MDELTVIMRSLGMSPTITELKTYMKDKGGKVSFADFLDIMHSHSKKESIPKELLEAFRGMDPQKRGTIPAKDLWHILVKWGEKLSAREGETVRHIFSIEHVHCAMITLTGNLGKQCKAILTQLNLFHFQWIKSSVRPTSNQMEWSTMKSLSR